VSSGTLPQFSFSRDPILEIVAASAATLEVEVIGANRNLLVRHVDLTRPLDDLGRARELFGCGFSEADHFLSARDWSRHGPPPGSSRLCGCLVCAVLSLARRAAATVRGLRALGVFVSCNALCHSCLQLPGSTRAHLARAGIDHCNKRVR
jgi:hypothetical protein